MPVPVICLGTASQTRTGIGFTVAEIAGPLQCFGLLGLFALRVLAALLRKLPGRAATGRPY